MGQKVNPNGFRVGVIRDWNTRWYANKKDFANFLVEDKKIRDYLKNKYFEAGIAKIDIARAANKVTVSIHTARPGMLIGKGGVGVDAIKAELNALVNRSVNINIIEVRNPDANAQLVAENIAAALEKRTSFRRAMKSCMQRTMRNGALGIKTSCSGRLGGCKGHQDQVRRSSRRRGNRAYRGLQRRLNSPPDHPCRHRVRFHRGKDRLRPHRRQGLDLQGRSA